MKYFKQSTWCECRVDAILLKESNSIFFCDNNVKVWSIKPLSAQGTLEKEYRESIAEQRVRRAFRTPP
jgi:hypothetical protein